MITENYDVLWRLPDEQQRADLASARPARRKTQVPIPTRENYP